MLGFLLVALFGLGYAITMRSCPWTRTGRPAYTALHASTAPTYRPRHRRHS